MTPATESIRRSIQDHGLHTVRVSFADMHGVSRGRNVPVAAFLDQVLPGGMEFSNAIFVMDTAGGIAGGTSIRMDNGFPNWKLVVDPETFVAVPWRPGEARVIADMVTPEGEPVDVLPRVVLKRATDLLNTRGLQARVALEYEFYLFQRERAGAPVPVVHTVQYNSELKHAQVTRIFEPLLQGLRDQGVQVEALGQEYSPSQYEVNLRHAPAVAAADAAFHFKQAVKEVMDQQGYLASFMSKPLVTANGSGCHVHLSLTGPDGRNLFEDPSAPDGLSDTCRHFIGGLLAHARALSALCNPTVNCYKRVVPGRFAPVNVTWGYDNRTCLVRIPQSRGQATHIEFRLPSAMVNSYVAIAAVLAAGSRGVDDRLDPGAPELSNAYANEGATPLPSSLPEALDALAADEVLAQRLGPAFTGDFVAVKRHEAARYQAAVTNWEWDEYLEMY